MKAIVLATTATLIFATGCATITLSESNTTIVMAKNVVKGEGAKEISDVFTFEGSIYAYITFKWEPITEPGSAQTIEARWFNGNKELFKRENHFNFGRPPYYVWFSSRGTALGAGQCRVEVYANGRYVGQRAFTVVEK